MYVISVASAGFVNVLLIAVILTSRHSVRGQSSIVQCHCNINRHRDLETYVVCSKSKYYEEKPQCTKAIVPEVPAGYEYVEPWGLFKLYRLHVPRDAASAMCRRHGGRLAIPRDRRAADALAAILSRKPRIGAAYVGIHDVMTEGIFYGDDGEIAAYQEWRHGEPGHGSDDDTCVVMTDDGRLDGLKCDQPAPFLCERPQRRPLPKGYRYHADTSTFLRLYADTKMAYSSAKKVCEEDGGGLAVPDTWRRGEAMARLIQPARGHVFIGLTDLRIESIFVTDDNSRHLTDMEFDAWAPDEPDNGNVHNAEDCLALHPNGTLFDMACDLKLAFLCELPPP